MARLPQRRSGRWPTAVPPSMRYFRSSLTATALLGSSAVASFKASQTLPVPLPPTSYRSSRASSGFCLCDHAHHACRCHNAKPWRVCLFSRSSLPSAAFSLTRQSGRGATAVAFTASSGFCRVLRFASSTSTLQAPRGERSEPRKAVANPARTMATALQASEKANPATRGD